VHGRALPASFLKVRLRRTFRNDLRVAVKRCGSVERCIERALSVNCQSDHPPHDTDWNDISSARKTCRCPNRCGATGRLGNDGDPVSGGPSTTTCSSRFAADVHRFCTRARNSRLPAAGTERSPAVCAVFGFAGYLSDRTSNGESSSSVRCWKSPLSAWELVIVVRLSDRRVRVLF